MNFKLIKTAWGLIKRQPAPPAARTDRSATVGVRPSSPLAPDVEAHREVEGPTNQPTR